MIHHKPRHRIYSENSMRFQRDTLTVIIGFLYQPTSQWSFSEVCTFYTATCSFFHATKTLYHHSQYHKQQAVIRLSRALEVNNQSSPLLLQNLLKRVSGDPAFLQMFSSFIFQGKRFLNDELAMYWMSRYGTTDAKYRSMYTSQTQRKRKKEIV
jgi:hypothetical protein